MRRMWTRGRKGESFIPRKSNFSPFVSAHLDRAVRPRRVGWSPARLDGRAP
jgi:hypothetical protein